jgi:hypothetical protein
MPEFPVFAMTLPVMRQFEPDARTPSPTFSKRLRVTEMSLPEPWMPLPAGPRTARRSNARWRLARNQIERGSSA